MKIQNDEEKRNQRLLHILRRFSAITLAEIVDEKVELPCDTVMEVTNLGILAVRVFLHLFKWRRPQTTMEIARTVREDRSNTHRSLLHLSKQGFVKRVSRHKWKLVYGMVLLFFLGISFHHV